jgi:NAD(P)-dependent dehydrogenase (short-subunit alcohol dehydrogenase family)
MTPKSRYSAPLTATALDTAPGRGLLTGRRLLVIGGGQQDYDQVDPPVGIGRAISILAAREGASVAIADIDSAAAQATATHITAEGGTAHQGEDGRPHPPTPTGAAGLGPRR